LSDKVLKIKKIRENAFVPKRATKGAAAVDLAAAIDEPITLKPGSIVKIPSGIAIELPSDAYVALVFGRSGLGIKHGITLANSVGVIDSDYRGEIMVGLVNNGEEPYTVMPNERIAQLMVTGVCTLPVVLCDELSDTERGEGGLGSTGTAGVK